MAEPNTNPGTEKAVTLESLEAAREFIPTKDEVKKQIAEAISTCASITFASTEEVLSIFKPKAAETETPEAGA